MTIKINDNGVEREMTEEELAIYKASSKAIQQDQKIATQELADRQALKEATLTKLGLTADEVTALLS
jgi:phosphopantetheinyl transferase (holo-ACP synthase)